MKTLNLDANCFLDHSTRASKGKPRIANPVPKRKMMMNPLSETPDETKIIQEFDSQEETSLTLRQCSGQSAFPYHSGISMLNLF